MRLLQYLQAPKWRILLNAIRNGFTFLGFCGLLGFYSSLHVGWFIFFVPAGAFFFWCFYRGEIIVRELRLLKGWYV